MTQYTTLTEGLLTDILGNYDIGSAISWTHMAGGLANSNFKVQTEKGTYVVKICDEKTVEQLKVQVAALEQLVKHSFPCVTPIPLKSNSNEYILSSPARVIIYYFLDGQPGSRETMTDSHVTEMGRTMGQLHLVPPPQYFIDHRPPFPLGTCDIDPFLASLQPNSPIASHPFIRYLKDTLASIRPSIENDKLPLGMVHGDFFPDNCMFKGDKMQAFLDFEEISLSPVILDVAMAIIGCFYNDDGSLNWHQTSLFLDSYNQARKLSLLELSVLPQFVKYSLLSIAFWRFRQFNVRYPEDQRREIYQVMTKRIDGEIGRAHV